MAYPTTLDTITNPSATDTLGGSSTRHSQQHLSANNTISALETKVGIDGSSVSTSFDYKLNQIPSPDKAVGVSATQVLTNKTLASASLYSPNVVSGNVNLVSAGLITTGSQYPYRTFYIPAAALFPTTTSGATAQSQIETTTNRVNYKTVDFVGSGTNKQFAAFNIPAPDYWDLGNMKARFYWSAVSGSGGAVWGIQGLSRSHNKALDTAYGTAQEVIQTLTSTNFQQTTNYTSSFTLAGTPAKSDSLFFQIYRDPNSSADTVSTNISLMGISLKFNVSAYDDQ